MSSPLRTLRETVVEGEIAPPLNNDQSPSSRAVILPSLVADSSSENMSSLIRRRGSYFNAYDESRLRQQMAAGGARIFDFGSLHCDTVLEGSLAQPTLQSMAAALESVSSARYLGAHCRSLIVTSILDAGDGIMHLSGKIMMKMGLEYRRRNISFRVRVISFRLLTHISRVGNARCCIMSPCFFTRGACVVVNSTLFFLFGRSVHYLCNVPGVGSLPMALCALIAMMVCLPSSFLLVAAIRNDYMSRLFAGDNIMSFWHKFRSIITDLSADSIFPVTLKYKLQEVVEEVTALSPPPYMNSDFSPPAYVEVAEVQPHPLDDERPLFLSFELLRVDAGVMNMVFSAASSSTVNRYRMRIGYDFNQSGCTFLPRCVGNCFFYRYFCLMMSFFFSGMVSGFFGGLEIVSDWLGMFYLMCSLLSVFILGAAAGFSYKPSRIGGNR